MASFAFGKPFLVAIFLAVLPWKSYACAVKSDFCWSSYLKVARPSCDVVGLWCPAGPEANHDRAGPKFRVQQTAPCPIRWMQWSCTEPDGACSPYLGRLATVSMTVGDSFVRRAKTSTVTPIFSFSVPREMYQEGCGGFWKNSRYSFFAATVWFGEPLDLQLKHIQKLAKNCSFRPQFLKKRTRWPPFFSHVWNSHETKDRYWKNQSISR